MDAVYNEWAYWGRFFHRPSFRAGCLMRRTARSIFGPSELEKNALQKLY